MFALFKHLLAPLLEHDHVFVPILGQLLIDLVDRHITDGLLRCLERIRAEIRLSEIDR